MMTINKRVLVCAAPDLNFIDGSSIWAQTITLALASTQCAVVDFVAKSKPERHELFQPLIDHPNVNIIDGTHSRYWKGSSKRRLDLTQMAELAVKLSLEEKYDVCLVRGLEIATNLLKHPEIFSRTWVYLTDIPQDVEHYSSEQRDLMRKMRRAALRYFVKLRVLRPYGKRLPLVLMTARLISTRLSSMTLKCHRSRFPSEIVLRYTRENSKASGKHWKWLKAGQKFTTSSTAANLLLLEIKSITTPRRRNIVHE
ncbi:hypothetical protein AB5975_16985 [Pseudomonas putida]